MASVQGMSFTVGDLPLGENKGGDNAFCWQDAVTDDVGSADFFDQFVVLDDHGPDHSPSPPFSGEEGGAERGGDRRFENMCREAHESSLSPPLTSPSCPPFDHHRSAEQLLGVGDHGRASSAANNSASGRLARFSPANFPLQHRQVRAGSHIDLSNMDCQYSEQHQLLVAGQRELSSILGTSYQEGPGSGGSISDSELRRLEGLTVNGSSSPRIHLPPSSASVPPSPHLQPGSASTSPRKSRLEAFYTKLRHKAANLHGNKQKQHPATTAVPAVTSSTPSTMGTSPNKMTARPRPHNLSLVRPEMPLSPPLTGQMASEQNSNNDSSHAHLFNTNFIDDPFMDISSNLSLPMHTPIQTPHQQHQSIPAPVTTAADNSWQFSVSGPPPTTPANPLTLHAVGGVSSSACELHPLYISTLNDSNWWDQAVEDAMDTDPDPSSSFHMDTNASNTREATLNLQMALQQFHDQGSFDDHRFGLDAAGLVLHMPHPTTSRVAGENLLHHNQQQQQPNQSQAQAQAYAAAQLMLAQQQYISNGGGNPESLPSQSSSSTSTTTAGGGGGGGRSRRPKPRAPSSGASRLPSYQTSPRKVRAVSRSSRESSPTRGGQQPNSGSLAVAGADSASGSGRQRLHRRSASMQNINHHSTTTSAAGVGLGLMSPAAVRKRKSFTGRGHASSASMSGSRLSHAASHGDLGASASAFAAAIGASGHRVVPEGSGTGSSRSRGLTSSASTSSLPNSSRRFTPLNMNMNMSMNMNGGFHPHHRGVMGYPPMPPLPAHLQAHHGPGAPSLSPPQHHHHHHHPSKSFSLHPSSSSRHSPSKTKPRSSSHSKVSSPSSSGGGGGGSGSGGGGGIGFVNFTPLDHHTLMSGVAPSGSSKTKARREREAAEQRRKLSEAMVKVVEAAGGDVRKLGELGELHVGELPVGLGEFQEAANGQGSGGSYREAMRFGNGN